MFITPGLVYNQSMGSLLSILNPGGILLGLVMAILLFRQRKEQERGRSMLAFLLLFQALNALAVEILLRSLWVPAGEMLPWFCPSLLLLGPLLLLYIKILTEKEFHHSPSDIPHFLPAAAMIVFLILKVPLHRHLFALLGIHLLGYLFCIYRKIHRYRRQLADNLSTPKTADPSWLLWFSAVLTTLYTGLFLMFFLYLHTSRGDLVPGLFSFLLTLTITLLGYRSFAQKALPLPIEGKASLPYDGAAIGMEKKAPQGLPPEEMKKLHNKLRLYMEQERPYRDPDLTLPMLAEETGINRNTLSRIINECEKMNFSDYINSARLAHARGSLLDPDKREQTILQIAFDAGFNSKTTFNTFFRKKEGLTPTVYRTKFTR